MSVESVGESSNIQSAEGLLGATVGDTTPIENFNPGQNYTEIDVNQLPEEYKGLTPTVKTLPPKIEKKTLPPKYETKTLPPKEEHNRLKPIFPPGVEPFAIPNF